MTALATRILEPLAIIARIREAVYVRLPDQMKRSIHGGCSCSYCHSHPSETPTWDTLVVPTYPEAGRADYTFTVHMPDPETFQQTYDASKRMKEANNG